MKFIRNNTFIIIAIITIILLIIQIESRLYSKPRITKKNKHMTLKRNHLRNDPDSPQTVTKMNEKCWNTCEDEKVLLDKELSKGGKQKQVIEINSFLYRRTQDIKTEYYICKCNFTTLGAPLKIVYYYANKLSLKKNLKSYDLDGSDKNTRNHGDLEKRGYIEVAKKLNANNPNANNKKIDEKVSCFK